MRTGYRTCEVTARDETGPAGHGRQGVSACVRAPTWRVAHLLELGPRLIGATSGSGTRVFARIVRRAGLFIGTNLNVSEDAVDFGAYSDSWINPS